MKKSMGLKKYVGLLNNLLESFNGSNSWSIYLYFKNILPYTVKLLMAILKVFQEMKMSRIYLYRAQKKCYGINKIQYHFTLACLSHVFLMCNIEPFPQWNLLLPDTLRLLRVLLAMYRLNVSNFFVAAISFWTWRSLQSLWKFQLNIYIYTQCLFFNTLHFYPST